MSWCRQSIVCYALLLYVAATLRIVQLRPVLPISDLQLISLLSKVAPGPKSKPLKKFICTYISPNDPSLPTSQVYDVGCTVGALNNVEKSPTLATQAFISADNLTHAFSLSMGFSLNKTFALTLLLKILYLNCQNV